MEKKKEYEQDIWCVVAKGEMTLYLDATAKSSHSFHISCLLDQTASILEHTLPYI